MREILHGYSKEVLIELATRRTARFGFGSLESLDRELASIEWDLATKKGLSAMDDAMKRAEASRKSGDTVAYIEANADFDKADKAIRKADEKYRSKGGL